MSILRITNFACPAPFDSLNYFLTVNQSRLGKTGSSTLTPTEDDDDYYDEDVKEIERRYLLGLELLSLEMRFFYLHPIPRECYRCVQWETTESSKRTLCCNRHHRRCILFIALSVRLVAWGKAVWKSPK